MVTVLMNECLAAKRRRRVIGRLLREKFGEQERLRLESLRVFIGAQQIDQLVAKDGNAARLETDDADAGANLRAQRVEDLRGAYDFASAQHAVVVERPPQHSCIAGIVTRKPGVLEDLDRSLRRGRMEVVVPGVGPQEHLAAAATLRGLDGAQTTRETSAARRAGYGVRGAMATASLRDVAKRPASASSAFTSRGATDASRAHQYIKPNAYAESGRRLCS